ncbi:MAG: NAD(P)-binding domain-containing protein [Alphaproteobacteria bacterium]|nr:NAD(P)-binding domain-containing protein [Alphaproteobacteria bacterium]
MYRLGFVGTGAITSAIVRGIKASQLKEWPVLLSPRSADISAELARSMPGVRVSQSNQGVVDESDIVFFAIRPQIAEDVITPLRFKPSQRIISLVAALDIETVRNWTGVESVVRAIPLTFVERCRGVTPVFPANDEAAIIFQELGGCIQVSDIHVFDAYAAAGALMSTYFGIIETAREWLAGQGLPSEDATLYLRNLFGSLGDVLREKPLALSELQEAHATRGGLNELANSTFVASGGKVALCDGLSAVLARIHGE